MNRIKSVDHLDLEFLRCIIKLHRVLLKYSDILKIALKYFKILFIDLTLSF